MTVQQYPRSPKALLCGIAHLGRFIDKIRMRNAGLIQDYNYITVGFDKHLIDFLNIDPKAFEARGVSRRVRPGVTRLGPDARRVKDTGRDCTMELHAAFVAPKR